MAEVFIQDVEQGKSKQLSNENNQLDISQCQRIGKSLKTNTVLWLLSLKGDNIGPGAKYIAAALHVNTKLRYLYLNRNNIGDAEAKDLAESLHVNTTLAVLDLYGNHIGDAGAKDFGEALQVNIALTSLNLEDNKISSKGGNYLLKAFDDNWTLSYISLYSSKTDAALVKSITTKAKANEQTSVNFISGVKTEVGKVLHGNGFKKLVIPFYKNKVYSVEQAYELSGAELKAIGNFSLAQRKVLRELFIPEYKKTPLGHLLVDSGLEQYAKMFYHDGVYDVTSDTLTIEDLKEVGINNAEHLKILFDVFNGKTVPVKPKLKQMQQAKSKKFGGFISHYKKEAGTTAKLMKFMIQNDARYSQTAVFLDTESLTDLDQLLDDVRQSGALVVILTKNYFHRPWCLTELVAAWKHDIPLVACRLVGVEQEFDPASFVPLIANYKDLTDTSGWDILIKRGFTKEDVRDAIERLSMVIARSFAPHESDRIQEAQFSLILDDLAERSDTK